MKLPSPLIRGVLIKRYKRFLADVELESGETITAHCANTGSMLSVSEPGSEVWLSESNNPKRKLRHTWEMIRVGGHLVGINTSRPNGLVEEAVQNGYIPELAGYRSVRREVKYGDNSRIDLLLEDGPLPTCYVEVKNVTMKRSAAADAPVEFPDAVTVRGSKHLAELSKMAAHGHRAAMVFLVQREDGGRFTIAEDIDPAYGANLKSAKEAGVEILCYACNMSLDEIRVARPIAVEL